MQLTGSQKHQLHNALLRAFPDHASLARMIEKVDTQRKIYDYDDAEYEKHLHHIKFKFLQKFYDLPDANMAQLPG